MNYIIIFYLLVFSVFSFANIQNNKRELNISEKVTSQVEQAPQTPLACKDLEPIQHTESENQLQESELVGTICTRNNPNIQLAHNNHRNHHRNRGGYYNNHRNRGGYYNDPYYNDPYYNIAVSTICRLGPYYCYTSRAVIVGTPCSCSDIYNYRVHFFGVITYN